MGSMDYQESFRTNLAVGGGIITPKTAVAVKTSHLLSIPILELAQKTLKRCERRKGPGPFADILEVYILVAVSLEAFINEVCLEKIDEYKGQGKDKNSLEGIMLKWIMHGNDGRGMEIREKWEYLPKCLWNQKADKQLDKGKQPWQDFDILIKLRNHLVHYKSEYREPEYIPEFLESTIKRVLPSPTKKPQSRGLLEGLTDESTHWLNQISNIDMGYWAFDTGRKMIKQFLDFLDPDDPLRQGYTMLFGEIKGSRRIKTRKQSSETPALSA